MICDPAGKPSRVLLLIIYVTKQSAIGRPDPAHASLEGGAGAPGITQEGIEAATRYLWESGRIRYPADGADQLLVRSLVMVCLGLSGDSDRNGEP